MADSSDNDRFIFELVNQRQDQEWQRIDAIDSKANNLLVFLVAIIVFLVGVAELTAQHSAKLPLWAEWTFLTGIAVLLEAMTNALLGYKIRKWELVPEPKALIGDYGDAFLERTIREVTATMVETVAAMKVGVNQKAKYVDVAWYLTLAGIAIIFIYTILVLTL